MIYLKINNEEKLKRIKLNQIKDAVVLLFGFFGISFIIPAYIIAMLNLMSFPNLSKTILLAAFYSELLMFAILTPHIQILLEMTRTAIGRRTPYLLIFGTAAAFLLTAIANATVNERSIILIVTLILLFNFSLYLYSLAFLGLVSDKKTYITWGFLESQSKFWSVIGILSSYFYSLKLDSGIRIFSHVGLVFLITVFAVSFFIIEDKKYKVKVPTSEKIEIYEKYQRTKEVRRRLKKPKDFDIKILFSLLLGYQFQFLLAIHITESEKYLETQREVSNILVMYSCGFVLNYIIHLLSKHASNVLNRLGHITTALALFIFSTTFLYSTREWYMFVSFITGFLLFPALSKYFYLPGIGLERFLRIDGSIMNSTEIDDYYNLFVYLAILFNGILLDVFGSKISGILGALLLTVFLIIELITSRVKIKSTNDDTDKNTE